MFPGYHGGANWSSASFDPTSSYLYVNMNEDGAIGQMNPQPPGSPIPFIRRGRFDEYAWFRDKESRPCQQPPWGTLSAVNLNRSEEHTSELQSHRDLHSFPTRRSSDLFIRRGRFDEYAWFRDKESRPCQQPPWGTLSAVNLNTGEIVWQVPLGVVDELEAKGVHSTGSQNLGGSIVTAGGLVFIASTTDRRFRAFDSRTGSQLWETRLEANGHATPMTFQGKKSGKQIGRASCRER